MLKIEEIDVFYGDVQALWGVSLEVNEGEIVALIGSNGAGKTTTLRTISGLLRPKRGHITFQGKDITRVAPSEIVAMGIAHIPEGRQLWPGMSVEENLRLGAYNPNARPYVEESLAWVYDLFPRLKDRRRQRAGTLSGGEQQMCAIARGLMARPRLLMLDEPSLGLAPMLVEMMFEVLQHINEQGMTILLVEQNVHHALEIANRAYVLETGRITLYGLAASLVENEHVRRAYLGI